MTVLLDCASSSMATSVLVAALHRGHGVSVEVWSAARRSWANAPSW
jgi:hypothetical protein